MSILHLLSNDNFITVNKSIAAEVGLEAAVILGELASEFVYWQNVGGLEEGFFYSTIENLEKKTFLSGHSQRQALAKLQEKGWIDIAKKGIPAKRYIRINEENLIMFFNNLSLKILTTGDSNFEQQEVKNFDGNKNIRNENIEKDHELDIYGKPKSSRFVPPSVEEVREYCEERNNLVDPEKFVDYYTARGWKIGKNAMKDWRAAVRTWERNNYSSNQNASHASSNPFTELLKKEGYTT